MKLAITFIYMATGKSAWPSSTNLEWKSSNSHRPQTDGERWLNGSVVDGIYTMHVEPWMGKMLPSVVPPSLGACTAIIKDASVLSYLSF